jgi:pullulanase
MGLNVKSQNMDDLLKYSDTSAVHNMATLDQYDLFGNTNHLLLNAFLTSPKEIILTFGGAAKLSAGDLEIYEWDYAHFDVFSQRYILINQQTPEFSQQGNQVKIALKSWNISANYVIKYRKEWINVFLDPALGGILDTTFNASSQHDFGVSFVAKGLMFKVWSPPAAKIEVLLFDKNKQPIITENPLWMNKDSNGVFLLNVTPEMVVGINSFDGLFYQYRVAAYGKIKLALDPYSFSMASFSPDGVDKIGKTAIVSMNNKQSIPADFSKKYSNGKFMANEADLVAYEVHIRDFTVQPGVVQSEVSGTYKGAISKIDYLKQLGITHVQLLPVMNFYTVEETNRSFSDSNAQKSNYNWGYDPHNYFALEGWFSTDPANPYTRIKEYRELVQALHNKGIGVIMDVVYNHTYLAETFENIAPGCYYRLTSDLKISGHSGAGPSLECRRLMVRKLIVESLQFFIKQYHIDGFRFDLMGFFDHETIRIIRQEVGKSYNPKNPNELILQGEAWVFSDLDTSIISVDKNTATTKINHPKENLNLGFFNDSSRDSYAGTADHRGFIQGNYAEIDRVASGIVGGVKGFNLGPVSFNNDRFKNSYNLFAEFPTSCLNYLSVHDGLTLWDKINLLYSDSSGLIRARQMRMASAMLFTSQGKIILQAGDEFLRTKPLAKFDKERNRALTSNWINEEEGTTFFHENSYCSNDFTNMIRWNRLNDEYAPIARQMVEYYKGLILMRRAIPALRLQSPESVKKAIQFIPSTPHIATTNPSYFTDFSDNRLTELTLTFIHGPANQTYYLAGEIHRKGVNANPVENPFMVHFDAQGVAKISFNKKQIEQFDMGKWGDGISLNIKLVKNMGGWETISSAYSDSGHNVIMIQGVHSDGSATIDLAIENNWVGIPTSLNEPWIAYMIDNTLEKKVSKSIPKVKFSKILVIHNAGDNASEIPVKEINDPTQWHVIVDANTAGITPLNYSEITKIGFTDVLISKGKVVIPARSSAVIVK